MAGPETSGRLSAYAAALGMEIVRSESGSPVIGIDFSHNLEGRPGALHGGAIGGILETAGYAALRSALDAEGRSMRLKPINITVQYLRSGKTVRTEAVARITRLGRRNANLSVEAWQGDRSRPIATAVMNVLMQEFGSDAQDP